MNLLLMFISLIAFSLNMALTRALQIKFPGNSRILRLYQGLFCLSASVLFGASYLMGGGNSIGGAEILAGILFGVLFYAQSLTSAICCEHGPMSLTSIVMNMSLFIPLLYSVVFLREPLTLLYGIGIVLIVVTMTLAVEPGGKKSGDTAPWWFAVLLLAFLVNGLGAVVQKVYVIGQGDSRLMAMMAVAYLSAAVLFGFHFALTPRTETSRLTKPWLILAAAVLSGLGSFGGNGLLGILCVRVNSAVLYPFVNGGLSIMGALLSFFLFRERITRRKIIAIAIGVVAIVVLNL